ncbi:hypothetical protein KP509_21G041200 [Ceratopteris richardii]|uniref:non-specific serine/threonine protein kinase n=1 Tax=Ceratopteris richardii TaxID=49495 RepID=A0A8T2S989_CERRI|nr:hypothetical protein KP509_21G041200 [Ceratopteris richardii]KAH7315238.1 hypothetical protein KP509_21G041200 [Ceratopteris richardii]KAH7315239.1 hypothetical protein KP509_21G041200 [Ceratopteris richardii]KAH7315241.1 hypothetical protein KP509_21G041200 [Ceratopteris richardii]KAH7315243.1 hypothetical protein KP509_21G041200 [Ceratopteris richardii]
MQYITPKSTSLKQSGSCIPMIDRCFFPELPSEIDDTSAPLNAERISEDILENRLQRLNDSSTVLTIDGSTDHVIPNADAAFLSQGLVDDQGSGSGVAFHKRICIPLWKKVKSAHAPQLLQHVHETSVDINFYSSRGGSALQGKRIMHHYGIPKDEIALSGKITLSPLLCPWRCFTIEEIRDATRDFHADNIVGKGGFAKVYKGILPGGDVIAIKELYQSNTAEMKEKEFLIEIGIMAHVRHPNITPLIGFCLEGGLYLVYNFYLNGSLAENLHGTRVNSFDWSLRYKVAFGIAQGLLYLHEQCRRRIIHRDIKASNILLDGDFEPHIADFGLAKWLPKDWSHHSVSPVEGTFGYLAPEYHMHGIVDEKIDTYSYGVLLLEIISGRRPIDDSQQCLIHWAKPLLESQNMEDLADPDLRGCYNRQQMRCMLSAAEMCVRQSSISRPPMSQVVQLLDANHI